MQAPFVAPDLIRRQAWGSSYERGVAYFRSDAVRGLVWNDAARTLTGEVRGSGRSTYVCTIRFAAPGADRALISAICSCPVGEDCKHAVATLLASNGDRAAVGTGPADAADVRFETTMAPPAPLAPPRLPERAPSWRDLVPAAPSTAGAPLALGFELRQRDPYDPRRWDPRQTVAVTPRALAERQDELSLAVRPLTLGTKGRWIKSGATWDDIRRDAVRFGVESTRWFTELHAILHPSSAATTFASMPEWLTLDDAASAHLWRHLAGARALGIPLVAVRGTQSVELADAALVDLVVAPASGGGLLLSARVTVDGVEVDPRLVRRIGRFGLYAFTLHTDPIRITLGPGEIPEPVAAILARPGPMIVPPGDREEFLRDAYPRLARRANVVAAGDLALPGATPPTLRVAADFGDDRVSFALTWSYQGLPPFAYASAAHPDRDSAAEDAVRRAAEDAWASATDLPFASAGAHADADAAEFAARVLPALEALDDVRVESSGVRPRYRELTGAPEVAVSTVETTDRDWFDLGVLVRIDGRTIPLAPLLKALTLGTKRMKLSDGAYFSLAHPSLARLKELLDEAAALDEWETGARISRYQTALWADFEDVADTAESAVAWRRTVQGLRDSASVDAIVPPAGLRADLRPYQQTGFEWLAFLWRQRLGGILADDMGLGKTLQTLALIAHARETGETRPFLVVAPTSVVPTWAAEAARFVPGLGVTAIDSTTAKSGTKVTDVAATAQLVVTSYALLRLDEDDYAAAEWAGVILDEAQFVKNPKTRLHRAVASLRADVTFAITGTPLENGLADLWALLVLTAPGLFPSARRFREEYISPIEHGKVPENVEGGPFRAARLERLRHRIRPLVLRRTKELVAPDLPPKQEQDLSVELTPAHRALYDTVLQRERQKVLGLLDDLDRNRFIVFRSLTLLRMLSLAPELIDPKHERLGSSKLDALLSHVAELAAEGHRALVFSQFTSFLSLAASRLDAAGIDYAYLDGATNRRADVIEGFRGGDAPVFLISLKAGGFGLTLTEADYVFLLDPWWNPAAEEQAIDRTHRIGQNNHVFVYRLLSAGTIEQKVRELQQRKARLFASVMDDGDLFAQSLTADDIRGLLGA